jgi:hypothetical protein
MLLYENASKRCPLAAIIRQIMTVRIYRFFLKNGKARQFFGSNFHIVGPVVVELPVVSPGHMEARTQICIRPGGLTENKMDEFGKKSSSNSPSRILLAAKNFYIQQEDMTNFRYESCKYAPQNARNKRNQRDGKAYAILLPLRQITKNHAKFDAIWESSAIMPTDGFVNFVKDIQHASRFFDSYITIITVDLVECREIYSVICGQKAPIAKPEGTNPIHTQYG